MQLADVVATSIEVGATRSRKAKVAALASRLLTASTEELPIVTSYLAGSLRQRRTGLGWCSLTALPAPAAEPSLSVVEVDAAYERMGRLAGPGSAT
ncbi:MAG: ATP-dependent DNA ligase, partial [Nocardioidaceae bacterium]